MAIGEGGSSSKIEIGTYNSQARDAQEKARINSEQHAVPLYPAWYVNFFHTISTWLGLNK